MSNAHTVGGAALKRNWRGPSCAGMFLVRPGHFVPCGLCLGLLDHPRYAITPQWRIRWSSPHSFIRRKWATTKRKTGQDTGLVEQVYDAGSIPGSRIICKLLCGSLHAYSRNGQVAAYLFCKPVGYFIVSRYSFAVPRFRVAPKRMLTTLSFQVASMFTKVSQKRPPLHWITTTS